MDIDDIRKKLDGYDSQLIDLLAKRMDLIPLVVEYKKAHDVARYQPEREQEVIDSARQRAEIKGVNPDLAEDIMKTIIKYAHLIEKQELD